MSDRSIQPAVADYADYWRRRRRVQEAASERLATRARRDAARIASMLRREFGVSRVLLFGSLVRGHFRPGSDIDLAVEGLAPANFFAAYSRALELSDFWIDLKPLEDLEPHFQARVLATGEDL